MNLSQNPDGTWTGTGFTAQDQVTDPRPPYLTNYQLPQTYQFPPVVAPPPRQQPPPQAGWLGVLSSLLTR